MARFAIGCVLLLMLVIVSGKLAPDVEAEEGDLVDEIKDLIHEVNDLGEQLSGGNVVEEVGVPQSVIKKDENSKPDAVTEQKEIEKRRFRRRRRRPRRISRRSRRRRRISRRCGRRRRRPRRSRRRRRSRRSRRRRRRNRRWGDATTEKQETEKGAFGSMGRRMDIPSSQKLTRNGEPDESERGFFERVFLDEAADKRDDEDIDGDEETGKDEEADDDDEDDEEEKEEEEDNDVNDEDEADIDAATENQKIEKKTFGIMDQLSNLWRLFKEM